MKREFASKKLVFAFAVMVLMGWLAAGTTAFAQCTTNANTGVTVDTARSTQTPDIKNGNWQAQTFTVTGTGCFLLNSVTVSVAKFLGNNGTLGNLVVEIYNVTAPDTPAIPVGLGGSASALASATILPSDLTVASTYTDITVTFTSPPQILGGVQYAVLVHQASGGSGNNFWQLGLAPGPIPPPSGSDGSPYAGGAFCKWNGTTHQWDCPHGLGDGLDVRMSICVSPCPTSTVCVLTQGFWKTHGGNFPPANPHPNAWPISSLFLGTQSYTQAQLLAIFNEPVVGNGLISLAHQLIAAKLNVANGAAATTVAATITAADTLIGSLIVPPIGGGFLVPSSTDALTQTLDDYNNGLLGPAHCP